MRELHETAGILWKATVVEGFPSVALAASESMSGALRDWCEPAQTGLDSRKMSPFTRNGSLTSSTSFESATNRIQCAKVVEDIRDQPDCSCRRAF